jgi:hypothetical protein
MGAELGPAWLDYEAVERTVADFYPLYREPGGTSPRLPPKGEQSVSGPLT